jgi:hypothetical protein
MSRRRELERLAPVCADKLTFGVFVLYNGICKSCEADKYAAAAASESWRTMRANPGGPNSLPRIDCEPG